MLVHVTRFQDVQNRVAEQVDDELRLLTDRIRYGDANAAAARGRTVAHACGSATSFPRPRGSRPTRSSRSHWAEVWAQVRPAAEKIQVRVGQRHLARRSAVLRAPPRRPIGHRDRREQAIPRADPGRAERQLLPARYPRPTTRCCRWAGGSATGPATRTCAACTPPRHCARPTPRSPRPTTSCAGSSRRWQPWTPSLRSSASGSAHLPPAWPSRPRTRCAAGLKVKLSYSGDIPETVIFDLRTTPRCAATTSVLEKFIGRLDAAHQHEPDSGSRVWTGRPGRRHSRRLPGRLRGRQQGTPGPASFHREYIRRCRRVGELGSWTVRLVSSQTGRAAEDRALRDRPDQARAAPTTRQRRSRYTIRRIVSPSDESSDLDPDR